MNGYVLSRDAERDLEDLWDYIAEENVEAADRLAARLFDVFEELGRFPHLGHKREDLTTFPVLFWPVGNYLIIYRADRTPIQIVAVVHGSRDIPAFLRRCAQASGHLVFPNVPAPSRPALSEVERVAARIIQTLAAPMRETHRGRTLVRVKCSAHSQLPFCSLFPIPYSLISGICG